MHMGHVAYRCNELGSSPDMSDMQVTQIAPGCLAASSRRAAGHLSGQGACCDSCLREVTGAVDAVRQVEYLHPGKEPSLRACTQFATSRTWGSGAAQHEEAGNYPMSFQTEFPEGR